MPYTPPAQQSPASSRTASPVVSRSSSMSEEVPRSPVTGRPQLPRSHSSASYMSRQRRSPSITKSDGPPTPTEAPASKLQANDFATRSSVRQSPPPVNDLIMPTGAVISPPESDNSDSEEGKERGRDLEIAELQKAVRSIDLRREGSPDKVGNHIQQTVSAPVSQTTSPTALTPEARKISHSRSNTAEIVISRPTFDDSPTQTTDDSEEDEDGPLSKPSLVRKKSGELVKPALRPSSRRRYSSMPGTPTYHKSVHFNESENQTRHFLQVDKPMAVSAGSSPVETYDSESEYPFDYNSKPVREIKLSNFPQDTYERKLKPVRVERLFLSADKDTLVGTVAVQNLSFQKLVVARFTLDHWKTTSEIVAEYNNDRQPSSDGCDKFNFHIKLSDSANIESKTLLLCVRYSVNGQDYWDNNDDLNYQVDFTKVTKKSKNMPNSSLGARPLSAIPRSRHLPPSASSGRGRSESTDDEFGTRFDMGSTYQFSTPDKIITESGASIKLKPKPKRATIITNGTAQPHNNLGGRYDFSASLSAALSTAQDRLGRNSGLMNGAPHKPSDGYFGLQERSEAPLATKEEKPDFSVSNVSSDRPAMGSAQYRDLVQKFCYFTSPGTGKGTASPQNTRNTEKPAAADGTDDDASVTTVSSGSSSPYTPEDELNTRKGASTTVNTFVSRSNSPSPLINQDYTHRAASPASFGYPYPNSMRDGYFDAPQPTAIRG